MRRSTFLDSFRNVQHLNLTKPNLQILYQSRRRADEDDELFSSAQFDDTREVGRKLQEERIRAWQSMRAFIETYKKRDFGQLWIALCRDDVEAKNAIQSYFRDYVENSRTSRLSLGEEEYETVQTITTTNTVIEHWKNLVAHADNTVLREKRREDPDNSRLWKLRWDPGKQTDRPVADISNYIRKNLAEKYGLIRESELTFKKVETTSDDLLVLLNTLWTRAEDVPCQPESRASLHFTLILAGFGFRPGSLLRICYNVKDLRLFVVRDPHHLGEMTLAATITVVHDKRHTADPRSQKPGIAHSTYGKSPATEILSVYIPSVYLPQHIRKEIMPIVFDPEAAGTHEELYKMLRRATARRDENAPLYPTVEDTQRLERRRDMQRLKREYETARDEKGDRHPDAKRAFAAYAKRRSDLRKLVVEHRRVEYFKEADRRRALGQSTSDLSTPTALLSKPRTRTEVADRAATRIGRFLREQHLGGKRRAQHFSQLLLAYLGNRYTEVEAMIDSLEESKSSHDAAEQMPVQYTCLLCCAVFPYRGNLTRHNQNDHYMKRAFDRPFPCPECNRLGRERYMVEGVEQWSNHVERCHGIMFAPCLPSKSCLEQGPVRSAKPKLTTTESARCLVCENMFYPGSSFSRHFNKEHKDLFRGPFACFECHRQDGSVIMIESRAAWMDHLAEVHGFDGWTLAELSGERKVLGKRKREEDSDQPGQSGTTVKRETPLPDLQGHLRAEMFGWRTWRTWQRLDVMDSHQTLYYKEARDYF
ncbi:hypothetical protein N657DRAFT_675226 [Parathielavia appendiculata]|uniref:C2H2-type domain-containing protein n=1 Tax=Parathielavia appendiculata TaxID=2587402 RepID=A0AAN6TRH0_9PEZI|nr:hypothetical protein N657DRAFT_675226 [Parathielavia appendiculata]